VVVVVLPLPRDGGVEELHGDPTDGPRLKVWTGGQNENSRRFGETRWSDPLGKLPRHFGPTLVREARTAPPRQGGDMLVQ